MWDAADLASGLDDAPEYGFRVLAEGHDWPLLKKKRDAYILRLNDIYETNLAKRNVELVRGRAHFVDTHTVVAAGRKLTADHIVVATGGRPLLPAIPGAELGITSDGFFELEERPERVAVVGSGYIAVELTVNGALELEVRDGRRLTPFDCVLWAIGRAPTVEELGLERAGAKLDA